MEDHSLRGYLQRQTTEKLESILEYCLQEENYTNHEHIILEILDILNDRFVPYATSQTALQVRKRLLRDKPEN